jgi:hypothetical protein
MRNGQRSEPTAPTWNVRPHIHPPPARARMCISAPRYQALAQPLLDMHRTTEPPNNDKIAGRSIAPGHCGTSLNSLLAAATTSSASYIVFYTSQEYWQVHLDYAR